MARMRYEHGVRTVLSDLVTLPYLRRSLLMIALLSVPAGMLGAWIVVRRMAFFTHTVGQATFPALVVAAVAGWSLLGASVVAAVAVALAMAALSRRPELADGAGVALVLATGLAIGAVLVSNVHDPGVGANTLLFGSVLAVTDQDIAVGVAVAALTLAGLAAAFRGLVAAAFDRDVALAAGRRRTQVTEVLLLVLLAVAVAVSVRIVGSLLVAGLFLIPAATARLVVHRVAPLMVGATALCLVEGVAGLPIADAADLPPGAAIAATTATVFIVTALASGALTRRTATA